MTPYNAPQTVAEVIKIARAARQPKMNQTDFGEALGVTKQQVSFYEDGTNEPKTDKLREWLYSRTEWVSDMAKEIMVVKYRYYLNIVQPLTFAN